MSFGKPCFGNAVVAGLVNLAILGALYLHLNGWPPPMRAELRPA